MSDQLENLNLNYKRLDAISIDGLISSKNEKYWETWERPIKLTERACFLSHIKAWEKVKNINRPLLILEDDAILSSDIKNILHVIFKYEKIDYVTLEVRNRKKLLMKHNKYLLPGYTLTRLLQDRSGAAAYILWPSGAKKLLKRASKQAALADALICKSYELSSYQIEPACAVQLDTAEIYGLKSPISSISYINAGDNFGRPDLRQFNGIKYKIKRVYAQLRMAVRHLSNILQAKRRYVKFNKKNFL